MPLLLLLLLVGCATPRITVGDVVQDQQLIDEQAAIIKEQERTINELRRVQGDQEAILLAATSEVESALSTAEDIRAVWDAIKVYVGTIRELLDDGNGSTQSVE